MDKSENTTKYSLSTEKNTETQRGEIITVIDYRGDLLDRLVWEVTESSVFLCAQEVYDALVNGEEAPSPIGFPWSDVVSNNNDRIELSS